MPTTGVEGGRGQGESALPQRRFRFGAVHILAATRGARGGLESEKGKEETERERERERERNIGRGMNEREEEEEEEEGEPAKLGKKRGRPIINWPRISFVPFFLSVLSRATGSHFFSSVLPEESRDSPMAAAEPEKAKRSDDGSKEEYGGEARRRGGGAAGL